MDLEKARRKRASNRGAATRLLTKIKEALEDADNNINMQYAFMSEIFIVK